MRVFQDLYFCRNLKIGVEGVGPGKSKYQTLKVATTIRGLTINDSLNSPFGVDTFLVRGFVGCKEPLFEWNNTSEIIVKTSEKNLGRHTSHFIRM